MAKPKNFDRWTQEDKQKWRDKNNEQARKRRATNPEKHRKQSNEQSRRWRIKNPEKVSASNKRSQQWRKTEYAKIYQRQYRIKNREKINKIHHKSYLKNKEKYSLKYKDNPHKYIERALQWRKANPEKVNKINQKSRKKQKQEKAAIQFFQMTQAVAEIANMNTTKPNENKTRKQVGASI